MMVLARGLPPHAQGGQPQQPGRRHGDTRDSSKLGAPGGEWAAMGGDTARMGEWRSLCKPYPKQQAQKVRDKLRAG